ncbi:MAG TPA: PAS domain S-box protein [Candidatus Binataceae bacterium]|nr:PAS domain S-box protein [Candidatus Binataceae bacterium]
MDDDDIKDLSNERDDYALQQSVIASLSQHALGGGELQQLFDEATQLARQTLQIDYTTVTELRPDRETLIGRAGAGWEPGVVRAMVAETGARSQAGYALLVNAPVIVTDFSSERRLHSSVAERWALRSGVTVVIRGRDRPFGVLSAHHRQKRQYSHDEVNFLRSVANILGLAIAQSQTETELRASERYFRSLIEESSDLITVFDFDGTIRFESPSIEKVAGCKAEEVIGKNVLAFCDPKDRAALSAELRRVAEGGSDEAGIRVRMRHRDGTWRVLERKLRLTVDGKGAPCIVANSRDVTARERMLDDLRESERRFRGIFDSSRDAIMIATPEDGRIVDVNSAFSRIYGHAREQALVKNPQELALFVNPQDYRRFEREILERGAVSNFEADLRAHDGRTVPTLLSSVMVDLGVGVRVVSILRDISERRAADLELASARDSALESMRLKSAFLANTSHEIRTPLNVILGYTDLIGEHLANIGDHTQDRYLEALGRAGRRLLKTIQQILDYSRLEAGALALNPSAIALAPFIEDQANDLNVLAAEKGLKLRLEITESDATVRFDEYCLQSALSNLLHNAIKFTDRGEIVLGLERDATGTLKLEVRDTGIGIEDDYLPRLFEPFSQEQTGHSRRFEGAGLGLAFARKCVELGGARISAASRKGEGSTFTIAFPRACEIRRRRS